MMIGGRRVRLVWFVVAVAVLALLAGTGVVTALTTGDAPSSRTRGHFAVAPRYSGPSLARLSSITEPPTTTSTSVPPAKARPASCQNSYDRPACGTAHWDPPIANQPAELLVSIEPEHPHVGELVTFTFHWSDADADVPLLDFCDGQSCSAVAASATCPFQPTGPWTPPRFVAGRGDITAQTTYLKPGTYSWTAGLETVSSTYESWQSTHRCSLPDPYASSTDQRHDISVMAAPEATTTSTSTTSTTSTTTTTTTALVPSRTSELDTTPYSRRPR